MISFMNDAAAEDLVEQDLAVVGFAVVDVEEEGAAWGEDPVGLFEAGSEEARVVLVMVVVTTLADDLCPVALALEAGPVTLWIALDTNAGPALCLPRVEGRVDIDELDGLGIHRPEDGQVVREDDPAA